MWIASTIGWFSVVRDRERKGRVLVRARAKADIDNLYRRFGRKYKMTPPRSDESRDYRWRLGMRKRDWVKAIGQIASEIDYTNFKSAVHDRPDQANKHSAYLSVWSAMLGVQRNEDREHRPADQLYLGNFSTPWPHEIDYADSRFDDQAPTPTKTIKSVLAEKHEEEGG
jgi:hypothetical protein